MLFVTGLEAEFVMLWLIGCDAVFFGFVAIRLLRSGLVAFGIGGGTPVPFV